MYIPRYTKRHYLPFLETLQSCLHINELGYRNVFPSFKYYHEVLDMHVKIPKFTIVIVF